MNVIRLPLFLTVLLGMLAVVPVHAGARLPVCFPNVDAFMVARYGPAFHDDENLVVQEKFFGKVRFSLFMDLTSGTNVSHILLRANARKEMCVVLITPPAVQLDLVNVSAAGVPEEFRSVDQAPPGMPQHEIFYRRTGAMHYTAAVCNHVRWKNQRITRKRVACDALDSDAASVVTGSAEQ